jgi:UDP-4-amino-4,6-dideoxy-N-acetyl-beta-L-altrosamine N-acetyltransferase
MFSLKPLSKKYLDLILEWRNSPEIRNKMYTRHLISKNEHYEWFKRSENDDSKYNLLCFKEDDPVGFINFYDISQIGKTAFWGFYTGNVAKGTGVQMEFLAIDFAFSVLQLNKLCCEVLGKNYTVAQFHRKVGFQIEGKFKNQFFDGKDYDDIYRLAVFKKQWNDGLKNQFQKILKKEKAEIRIGQRYTESISFTFDQIKKFAALTGYLGIEQTIKSGFSNQMVHGFLSASVFPKILRTSFLGFYADYTKQNLIFLKPIYPNQIVIAKIRIISIIGKKIILETNLFDEKTGDLMVEGEAEIIRPS